MKTPIYKLLEWNSLAREKKVKESLIIHRSAEAMINVDCPDCGSHLYEMTPKVKVTSIPVRCKNCPFNGLRLKGSDE